MKIHAWILGLLVVTIGPLTACADDGAHEDVASAGEDLSGGGPKCQSWTLGRKVKKLDCVQDAQCHWNQCLGDDAWGGFSNDVCAPVKPWQNPPCDQTFAYAGCPFYVPAIGDHDESGYCDAANPTSTGGAPPPPPPSGSVCISAANPGVSIAAYDCFEHGGAWYQCRPDGEWVNATLEASGKVFGPLQAPGMPVPGCLTTHRH
jgi:hypothetical protein